MQSVYNANATYFFTSFSSGTHMGVYEKSGALCLMGVRMILEVRRSSKRVPLLTRSFTSEFDEVQVPVQRVTYGGRPSTRRPRIETSTTSARKRNIIVHNPHETSDESDFWSGWPWGRQNSYQMKPAEDLSPAFADIQNLEWNPWSSEYFNYSCKLIITMLHFRLSGYSA
ncbi:unnamed protein product [Cylicostephanus goldi]|uniref:Ephrin RBD domain-containing protein n=1 Tax=Cylicostephanus goldi TaxID=71465 RepID=A0A3P6QN62_CYLGO|nr:unnamed protein product [Cylicostephanus goldi]